MFVETKREGEATTENKWRDSLLKAIDVLNQFGWCQGKAVNADGEYCLLGAVYVARYNQEPPSGPIHQSDWGEIFQIMKPYTDKYIADWNDEAGRTKADVIAALRAAAG